MSVTYKESGLLNEDLHAEYEFTFRFRTLIIKRKDDEKEVELNMDSFRAKRLAGYIRERYGY